MAKLKPSGPSLFDGLDPETEPPSVGPYQRRGVVEASIAAAVFPEPMGLPPEMAVLDLRQRLAILTEYATRAMELIEERKFANAQAWLRTGLEKIGV